MTRHGADRYRVVPAAPEHAPLLPAIERAAAALFSDEDVPPSLKARVIGPSTHRRAAEEGRLWVALAPAAPGDSRDAGGAPVGFAHTTIVDGEAHVLEVDVHPAHARRGVGTALMKAVAEWARAKGHAAVTLTTFRHLPWNAPFYARLGFEEIAEADLTPGLRQLLADEAANGLDRSKRVAMRLALGQE